MLVSFIWFSFGERFSWILSRMHRHLMSNLKKFSPSAGNVVKLKCALNISFVVPVLVFIHALPAEYSLIRRLHE
jgi:hypothetical protein